MTKMTKNQWNFWWKQVQKGFVPASVYHRTKLREKIRSLEAENAELKDLIK